MLIKICGLKDAELAAQTALAGADYVGLVFHSTSKHHVADLESAREISTAIRENGAIPVAVFAEQSADQMQAICTIANIHTIQLHGDTPRAEHHLLPDTYIRFYVQPVLPNGTLKEISLMGLSHCTIERDFILFDNVQAGKGEPFDWNQFHYSGPFRAGLAGGLNAQNVMTAIQAHPLEMVDTSSGVADAVGKKDIALIKQFIKVVRSFK